MLTAGQYVEEMLILRLYNIFISFTYFFKQLLLATQRLDVNAKSMRRQNVATTLKHDYDVLYLLCIFKK